MEDIMDDIIKDQIQYYEEKIVKVRECNEDLVLAKSVMPESAYFWIDYEVNADWAVQSMDDVKKVLKDFAKKGVKLEDFQSSDTNPIWKLKGRKVSIRLQPRWSRDEGAACRLIKIGEETITNPVYKLVCDARPEDAAI